MLYIAPYLTSVFSPFLFHVLPVLFLSLQLSVENSHVFALLSSTLLFSLSLSLSLSLLRQHFLAVLVISRLVFEFYVGSVADVLSSLASLSTCTGFIASHHNVVFDTPLPDPTFLHSPSLSSSLFAKSLASMLGNNSRSAKDYATGIRSSSRGLTNLSRVSKERRGESLSLVTTSYSSSTSTTSQRIRSFLKRKRPSLVDLLHSYKCLTLWMCFK